MDNEIIIGEIAGSEQIAPADAGAVEPEESSLKDPDEMIEEAADGTPDDTPDDTPEDATDDKSGSPAEILSKEETAESVEGAGDALVEPEDERLVALESEMSLLRERLRASERNAREISDGWRELCELYPDARISEMPDSFNEAIERGVPPAAAYALELRRIEIDRMKAEEATLRSRERSAGRVREADDSLFSPDEVRAMSPNEVRRNMEKIRRSMKSWR